MIKTSVLRYAAIGMATMSLAGFAAASTVSLDHATTGPDSHVRVNLNNRTHNSVYNTNAVGVGNFNAQEASTGDVDAKKNTTVGGPNRSGDATNDNNTDTLVTVTNGGVTGFASLAGAGLGAGDKVSLDNAVTGPDSKVDVKINNSLSNKVENTNVVEVQNLNLQSAQSGNVSAYKNTTVGGLSSGDAANTNHTVNTVTVHN
jgi:hypothetical protein